MLRDQEGHIAFGNRHAGFTGLEPARFHAGPVAAEMPRIEGNAHSSQRPARGGRSELRHGAPETRHRLHAGDIPGEANDERGGRSGRLEDLDPIVAEINQGARGAAGCINRFKKAGEFLAGERLVKGFELAPVRRSRERTERLRPEGLRAGEEEKERPKSKMHSRERHLSSNVLRC
jgi:hypothetical protein